MGSARRDAFTPSASPKASSAPFPWPMRPGTWRFSMKGSPGASATWRTWPWMRRAGWSSPSITAPDLSVFPINSDGRLGAISSYIEQTGPPGPNPTRQSQAHPHSVTLSSDNRFAIICDLDWTGCTSIASTPSERRWWRTIPLSHGCPRLGPRHSAFFPRRPLFVRAQ